MGIRENKELIQRVYEEGYAGPPEKLDRFFNSNFVDHTVWKDLAGLKAGLKAFQGAYPHATWRIDDIIAEGEKVAVRVEARIPTALGKARTVTQTVIYRIDRGKVAETWGHGDAL